MNMHGGGHRISLEAAGALQLAEDINHLYGVETTLIERPTGDFQILVLLSESGSWRVRLGDHTLSGMPGAADITADVSDGSGSLRIEASGSLVIPAPSAVTVKSYDAGAVLTYYFL